MTWTKLSDDYSDDCWTLSDAAFRLHTEGLIWSNRKLLDLRIPKDEVRRFAKNPEAVAELLSIAWWDEDATHYLIRHHAAYQRMRDAVVKQQEVNKANRAKRGKSTPAGRENKPSFANESLDESLNGSSREMDRTGQDGASAKPGNKKADSTALDYPSRKPGESLEDFMKRKKAA